MKFALLGVASLALFGSIAISHPQQPEQPASQGAASEVALGPGSTCPNGLVLKVTTTGGYQPKATYSCGSKPAAKGTSAPKSEHGPALNGPINSITVQHTPSPSPKCKGHTANSLLNFTGNKC